MRLIINTKAGKETIARSFSARPHGKKPSYFDAAEKATKATINGHATSLVMHPKKETGNRVNFDGQFAGKKGEYYFVDSDELAALVRQGGTLTCTTAEGREVKVVKAEGKTEGAKAPAPTKGATQVPTAAAKSISPAVANVGSTKPATAPQYAPPMGKAAIAAATQPAK